MRRRILECSIQAENEQCPDLLQATLCKGFENKRKVDAVMTKREELLNLISSLSEEQVNEVFNLFQASPSQTEEKEESQ